MERRTPQYIECARSLMRDHFDEIPEEFHVRMLATLMPEHRPAMITNALRHLETSGIVHAPGEKTYDGATGRRRVAVMVWRKGPSNGPRVIARRGGETHVPPSEALARLNLRSPHDKAMEIQICMAHDIPLENIAGSGEQPVFYVPRAWLDERAPESPPAAEEVPAAVSIQQAIDVPQDNVSALLVEAVGHLRTLVQLAQRGQATLKF
jgi:hypothetical protein